MAPGRAAGSATSPASTRTHIHMQPSSHHFYQPLWTLVGGGFKDVHESQRPMAAVLPAGADCDAIVARHTPAG